MVFLALLSVTTLAAAGSLTSSVENPDRERWQRDANAAATGLKPLRAGDADELRIWMNDVLGEVTNGYVVTRAGVRYCRMSYRNDGETITVKRGKCGKLKSDPEPLARVLEMLPGVAALDGKSLGWTKDCALMDGWSADIDGVIGGKKISFDASNTFNCRSHDDERRIDDLINAVGAMLGRTP